MVRLSAIRVTSALQKLISLSVTPKVPFFFLSIESESFVLHNVLHNSHPTAICITPARLQQI